MCRLQICEAELLLRLMVTLLFGVVSWELLQLVEAEVNSRHPVLLELTAWHLSTTNSAAGASGLQSAKRRANQVTDDTLFYHSKFISHVPFLNLISISFHFLPFLSLSLCNPEYLTNLPHNHQSAFSPVSDIYTGQTSSALFSDTALDERSQPMATIHQRRLDKVRIYCQHRSDHKAQHTAE